MAEYAIQFKGWQMGTWFAIDESGLFEQLKLMMQSTKGSKVKVRLDKNGLKITKMSAIPLMGSEKAIQLSQIKSMFTDPKFPLCFFCTTCGPDGYLLKFIVIRCGKEMCATGIVNYFRTLTYKKRTNSHEINESPKINNGAFVKVISDGKYETKDETLIDGKDVSNGFLETDADDAEVERITLPMKRAEIAETLNSGDEAVAIKANGIETKERDIKSLSKDVEAIQEQTLKKHPATISRQEYIDAHEKVYLLETELSRQRSRTIDASTKNPRHYSIVIPTMKKPNNNNQSRQHRFLSVSKGKYLPVSRTRVQIVNDDYAVNTMRIQRQQRPNSILRPEKENQEIKASRSSMKSRPIPDVPADSSIEHGRSVSIKNNVTATGTQQEPIYAQVIKNRASIDVSDHSNGDEKLHANSSDHDTSAEIRVVGTPPIPLRTVTFKNWATEVQKRPSKKGQKVAVRPHSYHSPMQLSSSDRVWNTHVPKPIEQVYNKSATLSRSLNQRDYYRPRVNSNSFKDTKYRMAVYQGAF